MSLRNRYSNIAPIVVGIFFFSLFSLVFARAVYLEGYQSSDEGYEAEHAANSTKEKAQNECLNFASALEIKNCFSRQVGTTREEKRAEQDLNAQREMANWAEGMLWASLLTAFVTAVGVFYVALTLREARETTKAALAGADAARAMNAIIISEQRPWVKIGVEAEGKILARKTAVVFKFNISLENVGRMPAELLTLSYCLVPPSLANEVIYKTSLDELPAYPFLRKYVIFDNTSCLPGERFSETVSASLTVTSERGDGWMLVIYSNYCGVGTEANAKIWRVFQPIGTQELANGRQRFAEASDYYGAFKLVEHYAFRIAT